MLKLRRHSGGETIIEVLVALSFLGLVLGLSYGLTSRNLRASQNAQERTEASQLAQSNLEVIKTYAESSAVTGFLFPATNHDICLDTDINNIATKPLGDVLILRDDSKPLCKKGDLYSVWVDVHPVGGTTNQFEYTAHVEWDSVVSSGRNEVEMRYLLVRIDP